MEKGIGQYDFDGGCAPGHFNHSAGQTTFSVGIFKWLPKSDGKGQKKSAVVIRVKGYIIRADAVYKKAEELCAKLDNGWIPDKKTYTAA